MKRKKGKKQSDAIITIGLVFVLVLVGSLSADELVYKFGNPSFSGINQSAHYLTIDEQERTRAEKIAEDIQDALEEAEREARAAMTRQ